MKIKHFAAAAATVLALGLSAPAFAQVGYVGGSVGNLRVATPGFGDENYWEANGALAFDVSDSLGFAIEGSYFDLDNGSFSNFGAQASLYSRTDTNAWGGSVAYVDFDDTDLNFMEISGFGQIYQDRFTGTARVFIGQVDSGAQYDYRGLALDGDFFLTDNAVFRMGLDFVDVETADSAFGGNLGFEWKPADFPFGVNIEGSFDADVTMLSVGARYTFGQTLKERSQSGPPPSQIRDVLRY